MKNNEKDEIKTSKSYQFYLRGSHEDSMRHQPIRTQVNMSRMTGRQSAKPFDIVEENNFSHDNMDATKSISFIKTKTSKKIDFSNQLSR